MHIRINGHELRACDTRTDGGCLEVEFTEEAASLLEEVATCIRRYLDAEDESKPQLKAAK